MQSYNILKHIHYINNAQKSAHWMPIKKTIGRIAAFSLRTIPYTFINLIAQHGRYYGTYGTVTNSCISTFFHFGVRGALVAPFTPGANPGCDDPDVNEKLTLL